MSRPAISVENLSKAYRIGLKDEIPDSLVGAASSWAKSPFRNLRRLRRLNTFEGNGHAADDVLWALKDVSFEVQEGEVLGVIGRNGAGKSTLLKILSRITEPTSGRALIRGRVSSLLEVGTGFHDELTGRENVYMNATILGMTKREIDRRFDEIVDFSGVERFLDTPVKRYSSGMKVRLAFAVAAHLEPEILIIDEVLAVGDAEFQRKCVGKMQDVASVGRTVLFVSHNMTAIENLCTRAVLLFGGRMQHEGEPRSTIRHYIGNTLTTNNQKTWNDSADAPGDEYIRVREILIRPEGAQDLHELPDMTSPLEVAVSLDVLCAEPRLDVTLHFRTDDEVLAFTTSTTEQRDPPFADISRRATATCHIPGNFLNEGLYRVSLLVIYNRSRCILRLDDVVSVEVRDHPSRRGEWYGKLPGAIRPLLNWTIDTENADSLNSLMQCTFR